MRDLSLKEFKNFFTERVKRWKDDLTGNLLNEKATCKLCGQQILVNYMMAHSKFCLASFELRTKLSD